MNRFATKTAAASSSASIATNLIQRSVQFIESHFGSLSSVVDSPPLPVIPVTSLTRTLLHDLFSHKISAIVVKNYVDRALCTTLSDLMKSDTENQLNWTISHPTDEPQSTNVIAVDGVPFNVALGHGRDAVARYFEEAPVRMNRRRQLVSQLHPLDRLRLQLDEVWPNGAQVSKNRRGQCYLAGVGRLMVGSKSNNLLGFAHVDELGVMDDSHGLFSANIYLHCPASGCGGELDIWPVTIRNRWDFYRNASLLSLFMKQDPESQRVIREQFGMPMTITPQNGDLVLISAQRPHAARGVRKGYRVSLQVFMQYQQGKPLYLDA